MTRYFPKYESNRYSNRGFTIIELIVTLSILLVMLGLINFIFQDTRRAVSLGIETGEVIGAQRGIASQFRDDFTQMIGPHESGIPSEQEGGGGFLVLTHKLITDGNDDGRRTVIPGTVNEGLDIALPKNNTGTTSGGTSERRMVRSDQIGFMRARGMLQPMGPFSDNEFSSRQLPIDERKTTAVRVWYGHLLPLNPDGTVPNGGSTADSFVLGTRDSDTRDPLQWLLGRQALFLDGQETITFVPPAPPLPLIPGLTGLVYSTGVTPMATVNGYSGLPTGVNNELAAGLTDYAHVRFENDSSLNAHPNSALVGANVTTPNTAVLRAIGSTATSQTEEEYEQAALEVGTFIQRRLQANDTPEYTAGVTPDYPTFRVTQQLPILIDGCSEFVVEFTADMYGGGGANSPPSPLGATPPITAYQAAFAPDGQVDVDADGNVVWYTSLNLADPRAERGPVTYPPPSVGYFPSVDPIPGLLPNQSASQGFVWRHDRFDPGRFNVAAGTWARTTSAGSSTDPDDPGARFDFTNVPNDDGPLPPDVSTGDATSEFCDWPYAVRIRYRLHDPKGQIASGSPLNIDNNNDGLVDIDDWTDSRNGIWFEQILPIDRPIPTRILP